ncbi:MAG TPA: hypothetical protein VK137_03130, partial [Planctomycetaceae bacterium]|nr:hypothetical protein [Planctomycetaceae bacterium]
FGWLTVHGPTGESLAADASDFQFHDAALNDLLMAIVTPDAEQLDVEAPLGGGLRLTYQPERASVRFSMNPQTGR